MPLAALRRALPRLRSSRGELVAAFRTARGSQLRPWPRSRLAYLGGLAALGVERLSELWRSHKNFAWTRAHGGVVVRRDLTLPLALAQAAWLGACALESGRRRSPGPLALGALAATFSGLGLRYWAMRHLGRRWSIRIASVPAPAITSGPYRWVRHPNYLAVLIETMAVPLVHGAYLTATLALPVHVALLLQRMRLEERLLEQEGAYRERLGDRPRLFPRPGA